MDSRGAKSWPFPQQASPTLNDLDLENRRALRGAATTSLERDDGQYIQNTFVRSLSKVYGLFPGLSTTPKCCAVLCCTLMQCTALTALQKERRRQDPPQLRTQAEHLMEEACWGTEGQDTLADTGKIGDTRANRVGDTV